MKIIVCLDQRNGMLFNKRRQSADKAICHRIMKMVGSEKLWMNGYSAALFEDFDGNICVSEDFLKDVGREDYCFVENLDLSAYTQDVTQVIVFRWDRVYPADLYFPGSLLAHPWSLAGKSEFKGNSHDLITQEDYRR